MDQTIRFCLAQINPTVGDVAGNADKIIAYIQQAHEYNADIVVFPELSLCGYPPEDLLYKKSFINRNKEYLKKIIASAPPLGIIIGYPHMQNGKLYNAAGFIINRKLQYVYKKIHLPNFAVFDEKRYFIPGDEFPVIELHNGVRFGINICRDIWENDGPHIIQTKYGGASIIVNISASPFHAHKVYKRQELIQRAARKTGAYYLYCNSVGGQDELVFDGGSFAVNPFGKIIAGGKQFEEALVAVDIPVKKISRKKTAAVSAKKMKQRRVRLIKITYVLKTSSKSKDTSSSPVQPLRDETEQLYGALVLGLNDYVRKNNFKKVVLGLSGGIDSSLTAVIAADTLGADNVIGITMPSEFSSSETQQDARRLAENLGISFKSISIQSVFLSYGALLKDHFQGFQSDSTEQNLQARIRGNILMAFSNKYGWLVLTSGNKSELSVGYCTLYGDTAGGFSVLKDVSKTQVYALAQYRNKQNAAPVIPLSVIQRPPTAELKPDQKDQDDLPPYNMLDKVLEQYIEKNQDAENIILPGVSQQLVRHLIDLVDKNEYKRRQSPPGIKISSIAFGKDRRMPITCKKIQ